MFKEYTMHWKLLVHRLNIKIHHTNTVDLSVGASNIQKVLHVFHFFYTE